MRRAPARGRLDCPWRPRPGIAHVWCVVGPVCEEIVPRDAGITEGLLASTEQCQAETCPLCLALVYVFFGAEAFQNALRTRRGLTPEYDDDYD
jgi:hypothetical protein